MPSGSGSRDATTVLADGRTLGHAECGDPNGRPVLYFHGFPGSRLEASLLGDAATRTGVRLIGVDRPGIGLSSHHRRRRLLDWPGDASQLADLIGLNRFAVVGVSGGAPYAAACAFGIPDRLSACGIVAGTGPPGVGIEEQTRTNRLVSLIARQVPVLLRIMLWREIGRFRDDPERVEAVVARLETQLPDVDRALFGRPDVRRRFVQDAAEAFRCGSRGPARDATILFGQPWGFDLGDIRDVPVYLWHGELDRSVPVSVGRAVAAAVPGCRSTFHPDVAHLSLLMEHGEEILGNLTS
jgi:pimeloyl-ACP methyl ester carboxylesterase